MMFLSKPEPKNAPSSNRLNTDDKLIIISSVTKDVYISPCVSLIRYHMQVYTPYLWLIYLYFGGWKSFSNQNWRWQDFMFPNYKFPGFEHPYNFFELRVLIQIRKARIQMDLSKNKYNRFPAEETINYIPHTKKERRYVKCLSLLGVYPPYASNFMIETENNSIQRQLYNSSII